MAMTTEAEIFEKISKALQNNISAALVTVLNHAGSAPGKEGSIMAVFHNGETAGTIGGGSLEHSATQKALECISGNENAELSYSLTEDGMMCGGDVRIYIKVFSPALRLIICGGGHIGQKLYELGVLLGFAVTIVDDREEFADKGSFPKASSVLSGDIYKILSEMNIDSNCYIALATRSHATDQQALKAVVDRGAGYVGMIGSRKKTDTIMKNLLSEGVPQKDLDSVYAPMGLDIASVRPEEIALSIISEIMLVKNKGSLRHMKAR